MKQPIPIIAQVLLTASEKRGCSEALRTTCQQVAWKHRKPKGRKQRKEVAA